MEATLKEVTAAEAEAEAVGAIQAAAVAVAVAAAVAVAVTTIATTGIRTQATPVLIADRRQALNPALIALALALALTLAPARARALQEASGLIQVLARTTQTQAQTQALIQAQDQMPNQPLAAWQTLQATRVATAAPVARPSPPQPQHKHKHKPQPQHQHQPLQQPAKHHFWVGENRVLLPSRPQAQPLAPLKAKPLPQWCLLSRLRLHGSPALTKAVLAIAAAAHVTAPLTPPLHLRGHDPLTHLAPHGNRRLAR